MHAGEVPGKSPHYTGRGWPGSSEKIDLHTEIDSLWPDATKSQALAQLEQSRSAFQSSNPIGQFIIHIYIRIRAVALTTP